MSDTVHTQNASYLMPDVEITPDMPPYTYVPLRGYSAILACFQGAQCVGWIDTRTLGYETAKAWIEGTGWKDGGL